MEYPLEKIDNKGIKQDSQIIHHHHKRQSQCGLLRQCGLGGLIIKHRLNNAISQTNQDTSGNISHSIGAIQINNNPNAIDRRLYAFVRPFSRATILSRQKPGAVMARKKSEIINPELPLEK